MTSLLVMAKAPVAGLAKTRLCPPATPVEAADIAAAALLDTLDAVLAVPEVTPVVAFTGDLQQAARRTELADALARTTVIPQRGSTFAERLANAHADVAEHGPVVQIGMDTPQVTASLLTSAITRLDELDAVLGHACDGGWWALGLRDPLDAGVLRDLPMSQADTGRKTWLALRHLRIGHLPVLSDVDTMADARKVAGQTSGRFTAAVTAR
ncbi:TIGR04282 family arsenosugar biosynthesis glycosyltransferase [Kibdelosporangium phytohabitans]|uniref:Glycosyltransferase involved in cell wall biogenesis n=1 Tax=Kibdelosporangium phytohabitans TaxID=860235 RepID=A0A0N9HKB2_9PSEU|nr:DUF2064 domain-containing protein [Kibdelosporangium phytohabitans]ALG06451.1 glycosyltransferase involved in cell wall biogenesis [Kibdelosporangium phytohabitans]MBE1467617.1 glycosyltransferase A (GT-A) superfamily protein (DUF2064 family) [Kibdelosporangium phytohabitans]